jgi:hypothetical protein
MPPADVAPEKVGLGFAGYGVTRIGAKIRGKGWRARKKPADEGVHLPVGGGESGDIIVPAVRCRVFSISQVVRF